MRMQEITFDIGWTDKFAHCVFETEQHVSVSKLYFNYVSTNLCIAFADSNPD